MDTLHAWIAGATGLVGAQLLDALLDDARYETVVALGRRTLGRAHPRLAEAMFDFGAGTAPKDLPRADVAFCCLGTTIAKAGSQAAFRAVDHDAVLAFARAAQAAGATRFYVVTALGADPNATVFYNRVKGETENDLRALGFASLGIARPSLLLGDRTESRPGERAAIVASRWFAPLLRPFAARPIEARDVAKALAAMARDAQPGVRVAENAELFTLAGG